MFYFKTITIENASPELIEKAIRRYTKIRNSYLDFLITTGEFHDDMIFAGLEKNESLLISRMKDLSPSNIWVYERFWRNRNGSNIFVRFNKKDNFSSYEIRMGYFSLVIFCMISFGFVFDIWQLLHNGIDLGVLLGTLIFLIVFLFGTNKEINKTKGLINKAIQRTQSDNQLTSSNS
jgi:hypothetical protein